MQENSCLPTLLSLIFIRGRKSDCVQLPKGLTVGTEPQQIPFVFLVLKGPAIVACRDSYTSRKGSEAVASAPPPTPLQFQLVQGSVVSPPLSSTLISWHD